MQVSREVVFDEMSCWYGSANVIEDADAGNGNAAIDVEQQSQSLSGPSESLSNGSNAWTGRLQSSGSTDGSPNSGAQISRKGKEKVDCHKFWPMHGVHLLTCDSSIGVPLPSHFYVVTPVIWICMH